MTRGAPGATPPVIYLPGARSAVIGKEIEKGAQVAIGDEERCGGMYILGQPQTGKSTLLVSLALNDVKNGYGILFIDPHTDAITALHARIPDYRRKDIVFLDPTKKDTSFGINLLERADKTDPLSVEEPGHGSRISLSKCGGTNAASWVSGLRKYSEIVFIFWLIILPIPSLIFPLFLMRIRHFAISSWEMLNLIRI